MYLSEYKGKQYVSLNEINIASDEVTHCTIYGHVSLEQSEVLNLALSRLKDENTRPGDKKRYIKNELATCSNMNVDGKVIKFIADVLFDDEIFGAHMRRNLFKNNYSYYFALMLQTAFKRGEICASYPDRHVIWRDTNNVAYDIDGVYNYEKQGKYTLIPFGKMSEGLKVIFLNNSLLDPGMSEWQIQRELDSLAKE